MMTALLAGILIGILGRDIWPPRGRRDEHRDDDDDPPPRSRAMLPSGRRRLR